MVNKSKHNKGNSVKGVLDKNTSIGRDCHAGQVAPDRHLATVQKSATMKIATWNFRTLNQKGKFENVKMEMTRMKVDILGLAEVRCKGADMITLDGYKMVFSGGNLHERGAGIMLTPNIAKSLKGFWPVSDRIIVTTLSSKLFDTNIIQVYAPITDHDYTEVKAFYEELDKTLQQLKSNNIKIIMGDFNAKVGARRIGNTVGSCGLGEINERGEMLVGWCQENDLVVANTWFEHHPRRKWTWISPGDNYRNQIDYVLIQSRFRNAVLSAKTMPGADCGSDHNPVVCKVHAKLKALKKPKHQMKYNLKALNKDPDLRNKFTIEVKNKFEALKAITAEERQWEILKDSIEKAAEKKIPKQPKREHKKWMTQSILDKMAFRRKAKQDPSRYKSKKSRKCAMRQKKNG
ncbi:craniofacial development protein 2-like [Elysia marginata]|uniref:Craniofacial development protein 2-like n=1 Tax=Elysia marginata TaxID=1093978 RepID=A0AAV4EZA6_9GAST|nr:craniofacial development protein 2-like [Elysia marginata]